MLEVTGTDSEEGMEDKGIRSRELRETYAEKVAFTY